MFVDQAKITVIAGSGGNGASSFSREKCMPKGGPNGGDGGRGGDIVFVVDKNVNTLIDFRHKRKFKASNGKNGQGSNKFGKSTKPLKIHVPSGTLVYNNETNELIVDINETNEEIIIAKGGRGGRGNARFATSIKRAPLFAELGEPGEIIKLRLELKLLADVGLIGYPNVGKSSILAKVSEAKPEIADYHFTTLNPVLGIVKIDDQKSFILADIPGLIEGAHLGKGLGYDFLRHIERTRVLIHVIDAASLEGRDPVEDFHKINNELHSYNQKLILKPQIIAANKIDLFQTKDQIDKIKKFCEDNHFQLFLISAATGESLKQLMQYSFKVLEDEKYKAELLNISREKTIVYDFLINKEIKITREDNGTFVVHNKELEKMVAMINFECQESFARFQKICKKFNIDKLLIERGIKDGDTIKVSNMIFEYIK